MSYLTQKVQEICHYNLSIAEEKQIIESYLQDLKEKEEKELF